jgi:hypothetical protein
MRPTPANQNMNIYDLYKPLRNDLNKLELSSLLHLIWWVQRGSTQSETVDVRNHLTRRVIASIYKWELQILAREALAQSTIDTKQKRADTNDLFKLVTHVRRITTDISQRTVDSGEGAFRALHPLIHQQARWQHTQDWDRFFRAYRIYNDENVRPILEQTVGIRLTSIFTMALAIAGSSARSDEVRSDVDYTGPGRTVRRAGRLFRHGRCGPF